MLSTAGFERNWVVVPPAEGVSQAKFKVEVGNSHLDAIVVPPRTSGTPRHYQLLEGQRTEVPGSRACFVIRTPGPGQTQGQSAQERCSPHAHAIGGESKSL
jgi:hypothetical protein